MSKYKAIDLFAGIGGIRLGFDNVFKDEIETVFVSEWDEKAQETYKANFNDNFEIAGDITKISENDIPDFDICFAGFPCQAFSMAGKRQGFNDNYKGLCRGTLFLDVARICEKHKPKVIFCENVKGLIIHDKGRTLGIIKNTFESLGYKVFTNDDTALNSKNFGVPQNRERVYIVAFRNDIAPKDFKFPQGTDDSKRIRDIIEEKPVSAKYYLSDVYLETLRRHKARHAAKGNGFGYEIRDWDSIAGAIVCGGMGRERNLIIDKRQKNLTPVTHIKGQINKEGVRKMTPREWARLQGFPDSFKLPLSDVHLYKQLGNSVTVNVIEAVAKKIKEVLDMPKLSGNKGEWSEIYAFCHILNSGILCAADKDLNPIDKIYFPVIKIIRKENDIPLDYLTGEKIRIYNGESLLGEYDKEVFQKALSTLLEKIPSGKRAFEIPEVNDFFSSIYVEKLKADSLHKQDIDIQIHDINTGISPICGFSIKSYLGANPTLINPGKNTNIIYRILGCSNELSNNVNSINTRTKIIDRIEMLINNGCSFELCNINSLQFIENLQFIDSLMPQILGRALLISYRDSIKSVSETINKLKIENPMNFTNTNMYEYKFKKLLCACALGMTPEKHWEGSEDANGGYIVVKRDGSVVCYHIYNRTDFEQYLYDYTRFDSPSTSRYDYASVYKEDEDFKIKFNLQVRFK